MPDTYPPEPALKEQKPAFRDIPPPVLDQISALVKTPVTGGETVYGGFSASANFVLSLADGRKIFAKGSHPLDASHGTQNLRQEISVYESAPVLHDISPRYLGVVSDGDEDGWMLGLWDYIDRAPEPPPVPAVLAALEKWRAAGIPALKDARAQNYIGGFLSPDKKWHRLAGEDKVREDFLSLLGGAESWLEKNLPALIAAQEKIENLSAPDVPLHGDLREDNVFQDKAGKIYIVDWPNACRGPAAFDLLFFGASLEMQGRARIEDALGKTPLQDAAVMAAALAGYFAVHAGRPVPEKMPRLRWMQAGMLLALLRFLGRAGTVESIPGIAG